MKNLTLSTKIKYHVSQTTNLEPPVIIERILLKLKTNDYRVLNVTDNSVTFDDMNNPFRLVSSARAIRRLDSGKFEISTSDKGEVVSLDHDLNILLPLLIVSAFIVFVVYNGVYVAILFLGVFITIVSFVQNVTTKEVGEEMLSVILTEDAPH